jgi:hypothetical protein
VRYQAPVRERCDPLDTHRSADEEIRRTRHSQRSSRFAPWQNGSSGAWLTIRRRPGFAAAPVSRLFTDRVMPRAYRVLSGGAIWNTSEPVLALTPSRRSEVGPLRATCPAGRTTLTLALRSLTAPLG